MFPVGSSKKYKYVKRDRILPKASVASVPSAAAGSAAAAVAMAAEASGGAVKPLNGMQFVVIGKTSKKKADVGKVVAELGGKLVTVVNDKVAACISTKGSVMYELLLAILLVYSACIMPHKAVLLHATFE